MYRDLPTAADFAQNTADTVGRRVDALEDKVRQLEQIMERMSTEISELKRRGREGSAY